MPEESLPLKNSIKIHKTLSGQNSDYSHQLIKALIHKGEPYRTKLDDWIILCYIKFSKHLHVQPTTILQLIQIYDYNSTSTLLQHNHIGVASSQVHILFKISLISQILCQSNIYLSRALFYEKSTKIKAKCILQTQIKVQEH